MELGATRPLTPSSLLPSLRYHNLHPDYIHERLQSLGKSFALRVLLLQVDVVSRVLPSSLRPRLCSGEPRASWSPRGLLNPFREKCQVKPQGGPVFHI